ncbi:MAG: glycosyl hydrolase [bacterium]
MGIDMANTAGWPFGGPWIGPRHACKRLVYKKYHFTGDQNIRQKIIYEQNPLARAVRKNPDISDIRYPVSKTDSLQQLALAQVRFPGKLPLVCLMAYSNTKDVVNITDQVNENGKLIWQVPPGEWDVYAVFQGWHGKMVERASPGGEGNVIDHFSKPDKQRRRRSVYRRGMGTFRVRPDGSGKFNPAAT